jgi:hypothetical protein
MKGRVTRRLGTRYADNSFEDDGTRGARNSSMTVQRARKRVKFSLRARAAIGRGIAVELISIGGRLRFRLRFFHFRAPRRREGKGRR